MADGLSTLNTAFTVATTGLALFTSIYTWNIDVQTKAIDERMKTLEERTKREEITYTFTDKFFANLKETTDTDRRKSAMAVALLNVIAQASTSESGESERASRMELPLRLGLLNGNAGLVANIDRDFSKREHWIEIPKTEDDDVRLTAVKALCHIARYNATRGALDVVRESFQDMLELTGYFIEDPVKRTRALAEMVKLVGYFGRNDDLLAGGKSAGDPDEARREIGALFSRVHAEASGAKLELEAKQEAAAKELKTEDLTVRQAPVQAEDLVRAVQVALDEAPQYASVPNAPEAPSEVDPLIKGLSSESPEARRAAISQLALLRQSAVTPLLKAAAQNPDDKRLLLSVATALYLMPQPVRMDSEAASIAVGFLGSPDKSIRQQSAEFLMKLEDPETVQNVTHALLDLIRRRESENAVFNAVMVMGTWVRILPERHQTEDGKWLWRAVGEELLRVRDELREAPTKWSNTLAAIEELLRDAASKGRTIA